ncbi:hypothetical protein SAMN05421641_11346 [Paracoccus thiocyanatus]|uniref:Uncharacterized protein n=1 Tax=Paracoccus thiocyanatus TaxID=34006 RepID=A0A1N6VAF7_9RHOB|nr:hypothetical protein [Paracoccus thiocyanatus]SIQ74748.1 hypothetical protein SAMN05421641_11346 [Paracoccus thiocyanatus]
MQHEVMRQPPPGSDNVGDVLASIRRLIAQDETGCRPLAQPPDGLPAQECAPQPRIEQVLAARHASPSRISPLVLDSSALIAAAHRPPPAATDAADHPAPGDSAVPKDAAAAPQGDRPDQPAQTATATAAAAACGPAPDTGFDFLSCFAFGPVLEAPDTTIQQMEETMLHANASVTPINPAAEAQAAEAMARDSGEPHLFAPQDKDAQKGTHLRGMIREAIRQELQGEIGNRLSRNLQQMIRHEIELALRQMCEED